MDVSKALRSFETSITIRGIHKTNLTQQPITNSYEYP